MIIDTTPVGLLPESPVLQTSLRIVLTLQLVTTSGAPYHLEFSDDFDRGCNLPRPTTLQELIAFVFRRSHPMYEYVAERNGVTVIAYQERDTFAQAMACFEYVREADGTITLMV